MGQFGPLGLGMDGLSLGGEEAGPSKEGAMGMGQPKHTRSLNPPWGHVGIRLGSSNYEKARPSKRLGRKHRALAKESCPPVIEDPTPVGRG